MVLSPVVVSEEERTTIDGQAAGSKEEARVATALDRLGHRYFYQFRVFDIAGVRGTFRIDFLVTSTTPLSTPLEVFGEFWHRGQLGSEDALRIALIEDHFRGEANPVAILWGRDLQTQEEANAAVVKTVGPG